MSDDFLLKQMTQFAMSIVFPELKFHVPKILSPWVKQTKNKACREAGTELFQSVRFDSICSAADVARDHS